MTALNTKTCKLVSNIGNKQYTISGLQINANIRRDEGKRLSTCEIEVYNLTYETIQRFNSNDASIAVYVTIDGNESLMFVGDVIRVRSELNGVDSVTRFLLSDGHVKLSSKFSVSYKRGVMLSEVIRDVAGIAGIPVDTIDQRYDQRLRSGYAYSGTVRRCLDELTKRAQATWRVVNGVLSVGLVGNMVQQTGRVLGPSSGLVGSPRITDDGDVEFVCTMWPSVTQGSICQVESMFVNEWLQVKQYSHDFGSLDGVWTTQVKGKVL